MELTPESALEFLKQRDVDLQEFASNPKVFDRTCLIVYRLLPPPVRWTLKEKGVRRILGSARDLYISRGDSTAAAPDPRPATLSDEAAGA